MLDFAVGGIVGVEAMNVTDIERIIARVLSGELDAYAELVEAHQQDVWRVVAAMLLDTQKTEDLVQQTFVNAYRARSFDRFADLDKIGRPIQRHGRRRVHRREGHELRPAILPSLSSLKTGAAIGLGSSYWPVPSSNSRITVGCKLAGKIRFFNNQASLCAGFTACIAPLRFIRDSPTE